MVAGKSDYVTRLSVSWEAGNDVKRIRFVLGMTVNAASAVVQDRIVKLR